MLPGYSRSVARMIRYAEQYGRSEIVKKLEEKYKDKTKEFSEAQWVKGMKRIIDVPLCSVCGAPMERVDWIISDNGWGCPENKHHTVQHKYPPPPCNGKYGGVKRIGLDGSECWTSLPDDEKCRKGKVLCDGYEA